MTAAKGASGQPMCFKCARCKLTQDADGNAKRGEPIATGARLRKIRKGEPGRMCREYTYQYHCCDCHHTGWSRHPDIVRQGEPLAMRAATNGQRRFLAWGTHARVMIREDRRERADDDALEDQATD